MSTETDQPPADTAPAQRFHDLDALRAFAMLLGVILHTALFFMPDAWSKAYSAEGYPAEVSGFYTLLFYAIHGFRMPVFFLLSGYFTALLWQRRGLRSLAAQRIKRVGLPLAVGAFTVIPVTTIAFIWAFDAFEEVRFSIFWWPFIWLGTLNHLWFLWHLLWLCGAFIIAAKLGVRFDHPVAWWLAIPLTLLPQLLMTEPVFGPDTSDKLAFDPVVLSYYALFFVFGAFIYRRGIQVSRWWTLALVPALTVAFWAGLSLLYEVKADWAKPLAAVAQAAFAWLMCFGLMGLFRLIAHRERFWVRYLSDASYWIYLWHLPLVVVAFELIAGWRIGSHLKFALIVVAVTAVLLALYQLAVRYTPIGAILNGPRTPQSSTCALHNAHSERSRGI